MRIAILAHSTNPRGGVVHALELGDALTRLGHEAVVHAPDVTGAGFFRPTPCRTVGVTARAVAGGTMAMVRARIGEYVQHFSAPQNRRFDIFHAQDGISGNALGDLQASGLLRRSVRTVHHVDDFADPELAACQHRSLIVPDRLMVVSRVWRDWLSTNLSRDAVVTGNGVDTARFSPRPDAFDARLRARLGLPRGVPVFLSIGGVEGRKNSLGILAAFLRVREIRHDARLVIAGGATVLDHAPIQAEFAAALAEAELPDDAVIRTGKLPQAEMPALYRLASALVFPSLSEGFGLVVLEALASGVPAIVSDIPPFTEYLGGADVLWCAPEDPADIARAMLEVLEPARAAAFMERGPEVARTFDWDRVGADHVALYAEMMERHYA